MPKSILLQGPDFIRAVDKLAPRWKMIWHRQGTYLERFDEAGVFRPLHRLVAPDDLHIFLARRHHLPIDLPNEYDPQIDLLLDAIDGPSRHGGSPDEPHAVELADSVLSPYTVPTHPEVPVDWSNWWRTSHYVHATPVKYPIAISYYGEWQRIRFLTLLEAYTFHALLDPRCLSPDQVYDPDWDRELRDKHMVCSTATSRPNRIVDDLEKDGWLERLYLTRVWRNHGLTLFYHPSLARWDEGEQLDAAKRARAVNALVDGQLRKLGAQWLQDADDYFTRVRRLLELWVAAKESMSREFADALRSDLVAAAQWSYRLFQIDFSELNMRVGSDDRNQEVSLAAALTPVSDDARRIAVSVLPRFAEAFNSKCPHVQLTANDVHDFNAYVESHELGSWHLEFGALVREMRDPTDATLEKRFLHLRSLALLLEALLAALVHDRGTEEDATRLAHWNIKHSMKVFLGGRQDWRAVVWQCVSHNWSLTQVREEAFGDRLNTLTNASTVLCPDHPEFSDIARAILLQSALRNFGSHRFTNDRELIETHFGDLFAAVVTCALFYWKASTLD